MALNENIEVKTLGIMNSAVIRHLITIASLSFIIGGAYTTLTSEIASMRKDAIRSDLELRKELTQYREVATGAFADIRDRVRAVEIENVKDRDRLYVWETRMSVMETNILHIRNTLDNFVPRGPRTNGP